MLKEILQTKETGITGKLRTTENKGEQQKW